jgi:tRNA1Val (adenine37-N6)-methyltransferase
VEITRGTLLAGRVAYDQPLTGYRTGIEPVLLAASIPARAGQRVMEAGTGAGAGLLCLAARVPGIIGIGVERDAALAGLARANVAANGFGDIAIEAADLLALDAGPRLDHAMANPPWHGADDTASADARRDAAKRGRPGLIAAWGAALAHRLGHHGTLTFIVPARAAAETLAAFTASGCGSLALLPLWPGPGREARIILVRGIRDGRGGTRILPGLVLHDGPQTFTTRATEILRDGAVLPFEEG